MVLPLGPSKFYGSSLPRPRIYRDLKFNSERIDPPMGVTAPLMSWAADAPWSMGGLSHKRKRTAGKIEGSIKKLRDEEERDNRKKIREHKKKKKENRQKAEENENGGAKLHAGVETPKMNHCIPDNSSSLSAQICKPNLAAEEDEEDCSLVVPLSVKKPGKKRSPEVRIQVRNVLDLYSKGGPSAEGPNAVSSYVGRIRPRVHSVARSSLKRQARKITQVYDYVSVPDKIMQIPTRRVSPRQSSKDNKDKCESSSKPAGFESQSPHSIGSSSRRSKRILSFSPVSLCKGFKRVVVYP